MKRIVFILVLFGGFVFAETPAAQKRESKFRRNFRNRERGIAERNIAEKRISSLRSFASPRALALSETKLTESCLIFSLDWYGSKIIFPSSKDNDFIDIFSISSSGGSMSNLTNESGFEIYPQFSKNGTEIYYAVYKFDSDSDDIWKMNSDGSNKTLIKALPDEISGFCISPDETKIAYTIERENYDSLWIMNNDGTNNTELAEARTEGFDFSPTGNFIVFRDTTNNISKININIKELTQLTMNYYAYNPDWSPVEDKIVFNGYDESWQDGIWAMNSDGTGKIRIADNGGYPRWSPDGTKISYTLWNSETGKGEFWVMNFDGSNKIKIAEGDGWENSVWSSDSSKIAYSNDDQNIFVTNADGTGSQKITNNTLPTYNGNPCWNGDFTKIAYIAEYPDKCKLMVMDSNGSNKKELDSVSWGRIFSFYPHSTKIVYSTGSYNGNIFTINSDGTEKTQLTFDGASILPSWSPDLTKIAYYSGGYLKTMNANGSNQTTITEANNNYLPPSWSSDGKEIVYIYGVSYENKSIYIVDVSSPSQKTEVVSGIYGGNCYSSFSPDGTKIAYAILYDYNNPDNEGLWVINRNDFLKTHIYLEEVEWGERVVWSGNNRIYFAADYAILSIKPDGTNLRTESKFKGAFDINPIDGSNLIASAFDIYLISGEQEEMDVDVSTGMAEMNEKAIVLGQSERKGVINPDKGSVKFELKSCQVGAEYKVLILNLLGEKIYEKNVLAGSSDTELNWIPEDLATGIYILVVDGPGIKEKKKFAIVR